MLSISLSTGAWKFWSRLVAGACFTVDFQENTDYWLHCRCFVAVVWNTGSVHSLWGCEDLNKVSLVIVFAFWKGTPEWNGARQQKAYRDKMTSGDRCCHPDKRAFTPSWAAHCIGLNTQSLKEDLSRRTGSPSTCPDLKWWLLTIYLVPKAMLSHSQPPWVLASSQSCPSGHCHLASAWILGVLKVQLAALLSLSQYLTTKKSLLGNEMTGIQLLMILLVFFSHSAGSSPFSVVKQNLINFFLPERAKNWQQKPACLWEEREKHSRTL